MATLRRYVVRWSRRFSDGQVHEIRDIIQAKGAKRAASVIVKLYGKWPGFTLKDARLEHPPRAPKRARAARDQPVP